MSNNLYTKDLNTIFDQQLYPHLKNKLFNNLTLPYGLIVSDTSKLKCTNIKICENETINDNIHDKLLDLIEYKSSTKLNNNLNTKKKKNKNKDKKRKKTKKHKQ